MSIVCASTNCKFSSNDEDSSRVIFINFPNDDTAKIWAHNCGRGDLTVKSNEELHLNYYICSHHIENHCYISKENPIIIEQGAVPTLFNVQSLNKYTAINIFDETEQAGTVDNVALSYCDTTVEIDQYHGTSLRLSNLCRLCGESTSDGIEIFKSRGIESRLEEKIQMHTPISVNIHDSMPQKLCIQCYDKLDLIHSLVITCLRTDMRLRRFLNTTEPANYDNRYKTLVDECCLELTEEMCMDSATRNDSLPLAPDKAQEIVPRQGLEDPKDCSTNTEVEQQELVENSRILENDDERNIQYNNLRERNTRLELGNLVRTYRDAKARRKDVVSNCVANDRDCGNDRTRCEVMCTRCKDSFETKEMFENHKIICDGAGVIELQEVASDDHDRGKDGNECENDFSERKALHRAPPQEARCQICGESFRSQNDLLAHNRTHDKAVDDKLAKTNKRCGHCDSVYPTRKELSSHIAELHGGQSLFKCFACERTYEKWSSLDVHEATHRVDKPYLCDLCGKSFKHSNNLRGHKRIHLDESRKKRHVCEICGSAFRSRFHLREHANQHNGSKPYACEQCGKTFYKRIQLRQHKLSHGSNKYSCPICGATFNRRGNMSTHVKRHNSGDGAYTCSVCTRRCGSMSDLKLHRKSHSEEEIAESIRRRRRGKTVWQCRTCDRVFAKRAALDSHERAHAGERSALECDECGKSLASRGSLLYHKRSIHSTERPHMCQFCGVSFVAREARLIHERIHTGERPYACTVCGTRYRCSSNLSQHAKVHASVRPHECARCGKRFARKGALTVHERVHTGVRPYACAACARTFSQKNDMLKHARTHGPKPLGKARAAGKDSPSRSGSRERDASATVERASPASNVVDGLSVA